MYKISIIIPIYNVEKYIEECLESVLIQLPNNVQVICVNDGTKDNSVNIAKLVISKCNLKTQEQFVFLEQENQGLSAARNTGISAALGEYISFLDSDDKLNPNYFVTVLAAIKEENYDIVDFDFETSEGVIKKTRKDSFNSVFSSMTWYSWARIIKKELFDSNRFTVGIYYEDIDLTPRLYINSKKTLHLGKALYWYRTNDEGITQTVSEENNKKTLYSLEYISNKYFELYYENHNPYYAFMAVQVYFLLCLNASRRYGISDSLYYMNKYSNSNKGININQLPLGLIISSPKLFAFYKHPKIYLLCYSTYRYFKNSIRATN